ncbi:hypothetical protein [uncultured Tateyamaria sp.]|uniref:hypothetical protein n=1 Tax=Tateyamaria sp. 1078 TaxID=3417464 RepID=UPI002609B9CA|nr:hypothetical protein [uncultured Tateyamaria sp.]
MTTEPDYQSAYVEALTAFVRAHGSMRSDEMPALVRFASDLSKRSSGADLYDLLTESEHSIQDLKQIVWATLTDDEQDKFKRLGGERSGPIDAPALTNLSNGSANDAQLSAQNGGAAHPPTEPAPPPKPKEKAPRREPSKMYDYAQLDCARYQRALGRPIGMKDLFELGYALDANTKKGSHTAQLNRWKDQQLLYWRESSDITLTQAGTARRNDLLRYVTDAQRDQIRDAFARTLGITPSF